MGHRASLYLTFRTYVMNPKALTKAKIRLRTAEKVVDNLAQCEDYDTFSELWYVFLTSSKSIYTVLEQGAKASPQSRQWFGGKKKERRTDPLLQYIYQARNDDEHGIEPTTEHVQGSLAIGVNRPGYSNHMTISGSLKTGFWATSHDGKPVLVERTLPHVRLVIIHGRDEKIVYDPPTEHMGQPLTDTSPSNVAQLGLNYLSSLVEEAGRLS